eukprot:SAG31_NODE_15668_length_743_cov_2.389752_2_plen_80_part_01
MDAERCSVTQHALLLLLLLLLFLCVVVCCRSAALQPRTCELANCRKLAERKLAKVGQKLAKPTLFWNRNGAETVCARAEK